MTRQQLVSRLLLCAGGFVVAASAPLWGLGCSVIGIRTSEERAYTGLVEDGRF